jgi:CRP-like cAMP-binding protein
MFDTIWNNIFRNRRKHEERISDFLRAIPVFEDLSDAELRMIEQRIYMRRYIDGERIFKEGDPSLGMYIVKVGAVNIVRHMPDGPPKLLATLAVGDFFGEIGLIDDGPRSATAVAYGVTETIGFFKPDFMALIESKPDLGVRIVLRLGKTLSARLRRSSEELQQLHLKQLQEARILEKG